MGGEGRNHTKVSQVLEDLGELRKGILSPKFQKELNRPRVIWVEIFLCD